MALKVWWCGVRSVPPLPVPERLERATWQLVERLYADTTVSAEVKLHVYDWGGNKPGKRWLLWLNRVFGRLRRGPSVILSPSFSLI